MLVSKSDDRPFQIFKRVVAALLDRELRTRFGQYRLGLLWAVAEPLAHIAIFALIFGLRKDDGFGGAEPPVFVAAGIMTFLLWQAIIKKVQASVSGNSGLFIHRQVRPLNAMVARLLLEIGVYLAVGLIVVGLMVAIGFGAVPKSIFAVALPLLFLILLGFGLGMLFCVFESVTPEIGKVTSIIMKPAFFVSAVVYPMSLVPAEYRVYLEWNPVVHAMELIRAGWLPAFHPVSGSLGYLAFSSLFVFVVALASYRKNWTRMIAS